MGYFNSQKALLHRLANTPWEDQFLEIRRMCLEMDVEFDDSMSWRYALDNHEESEDEEYSTASEESGDSDYVPSEESEGEGDAGEQSQGELPDGSRQVSLRANAYMGPGAPAGPYHHYTFELYALDTKLSLGPDATQADVMNAMEGHILMKGVLVGRFHRP